MVGCRESSFVSKRNQSSCVKALPAMKHASTSSLPIIPHAAKDSELVLLSTAYVLGDTDGVIAPRTGLTTEAAIRKGQRLLRKVRTSSDEERERYSKDEKALSINKFLLFRPVKQLFGYPANDSPINNA